MIERTLDEEKGMWLSDVSAMHTSVLAKSRSWCPFFSLCWLVGGRDKVILLFVLLLVVTRRRPATRCSTSSLCVLAGRLADRQTGRHTGRPVGRKAGRQEGGSEKKVCG